MSQSHKKPILKDKKPKSWYKIIRRINKQRIKDFKEPLLENEIVNQYDICDWIWFFNIYKEYDKKYIEKAKRK